MKEVTKTEFYAAIGNQDACIRIENQYKWPYTTLFELRHSRKLVGKVVDSVENGLTVSKYYLPHGRNN